jgi:DNA (cytosine-5)-methyltransferase 1
MTDEGKTLRVFEAFAGYGSQHLALKRLQKHHPDFRFEVVGISEIDPVAVRAYEALHGPTMNYGDIAKVNWDDVEDFDLLTYSFPCTDISAAGRQEGFEEGSGTRSSLLWECKRAVEAKHPEWLVMENVKALLQKKFLPGFERWREWLRAQGYDSFHQVLNARDYGVPQNRERVFMVSRRRRVASVPERFDFPEPFPLESRLGDILEERVEESFYLRQEQVDRIVEHCDRKRLEGCGFRTNFQDAGGVSGTITGKTGQRQTDTYVKQ